MAIKCLGHKQTKYIAHKENTPPQTTLQMNLNVKHLIWSMSLWGCLTNNIPSCTSTCTYDIQPSYKVILKFLEQFQEKFHLRSFNM